MHKISITTSAFTKEEAQEAFDDFYSILEGKYKEIGGYLTLSFHKASGTYHKVEKDTDS